MNRPQPMQRVTFTVPCHHGDAEHTEVGWTTSTPGLAVYQVTPCWQGDGPEDPDDDGHTWWGVHDLNEHRDIDWHPDPDSAMTHAAQLGWADAR